MNRCGSLLDRLSRCGSTSFWRRFHGLMAVAWLGQIPLAVATSLKTSITYLIFVSLMTAFSGEMASLHGVTVEEKQDEQDPNTPSPTALR